METLYFYSIKKSFRIALLLTIFFSISFYSQVTKPGDTIYNKGKIELKTPPSISELYKYDPATDKYILTTKLGEFDIKHPVILTPKEYEQLVTREKIKNYFKEKSAAIDNKNNNPQKQKDLLPKYYVNSSFFETIFGGNTIEVKPTGSVEMDLGVRYTKQDNPAFSPRNRTNISFDFNQRINASLTGKVGTRLNINMNYDTQSTFAFQQLIKLEFQPQEDHILQKLEVGNVSFPLNSTLIKGAQSLFGVKAQLQFGRTTVTGVYSEQKSQSRAVTAQGGGTVQEFDIFALDYDVDRHFFLSQYFRNKYDASLKNYPLIDSRVQITRVEVWVTNRANRVTQTENNLRNIVALQDLGEAPQSAFAVGEIVNLNSPPVGFFINPIDSPVSNKNNKYDPELIGTPSGFLKTQIREIATTNNDAFNLPTGVTVVEGQDYSKLENARKLSANEFTYHPQLGYISLQQKLSNDEILGVAYEYTVGDKVYQVGEFGNSGVDNTVVTPGAGTAPDAVKTQSLILKMLKSSMTTVTNTQGFTTPVFNLMMKNIYQIAPGGQLEQDEFRFNIVYSDPSPLNYIKPANASSPLPANVEQTPLLKVFNLDRLNQMNDPENNGDGFFDYVPGLTVDPQYGRIIFTTVEPFGKHLFNKLSDGSVANYNDPNTYNANQSKYVFRNMYRNTQAGALQSSEKNKFELKGKYKSTAGDGIAIGAFNVPKGSVKVTMGGRVLQEGVDYTVNYQAGRVIIIDPSIKASNQPIEISVENNVVFGQQTRRFMGLNVEHKFNDKFLIGGTILNLNERPFTQKSVYGQESVNNTIFGFNANYATEVPFLTRMANKLPNVDTDVPSNISFRGEVAFLKPGTPSADKFNGESTIYVDDFEGTQSSIDMRSPLAWTLSSVPLWKSGQQYNTFGLTDGQEPYNVNDGFKRAKLAWYSIDPTFYTSSRPSSISDQDMAFDNVRRIYISELFPNTDIAAGQTTVINTLDLTYFPRERGPYNFNPSATNNVLTNPTDNFGGIMRSVNSTNFEQSNVEYMQFWMMDPYFNNQVSSANTGSVYINLGQISEDILRDGRKQYENGLPSATSSQSTNSSIWGKTPISQSLIYAFDTDEGNRNLQDVGFDGLNDNDEAILNRAFSGLPDPAADNFVFFLNTDGNVIERYKNYNGVQKNSPVNVSDSNRGSTTLPDAEDVNRDNTMNTINSYYQYKVDITPSLVVGQNYVTDILLSSTPNPAGGPDIKSRWIQFKIPLDQGSNNVKFGSIEDFRSIQFMRMFLTGFSDQVTLRFGTLDLVRGEWRRYTNNLYPSSLTPVPSGDVGFDVLTVNILDNANRVPIKYMTPPGVFREQVVNNNTIINQNEQSLSLRITKDGLEAGDSRAVFKNVNVDMRQYKSLKMFLHAEALESDVDGSRLQDNEMSGFIRFGNDFTQNYYQVERPLKTTLWGDSSTTEKVWPEENNIDISLSMLTQIKLLASQNPSLLDADGVLSRYDYELNSSIPKGNNNLRISVKGNPNYGLVRVLMCGVRNNTYDGTNSSGTPFAKRNIKGEVWFNELRLAGIDNEGGMAAVAAFDGNIADIANISATGRLMTIGFGGIEDKTNERSLKDTKQYNIVTNVNIGKLLPKKWGIILPFNYSVGEEFVTPKYDPFNRDIELEQLIDATSSQAEKDNIKNRAIEYTKNTSINFIGVKKERTGDKKPHIYDPENLTLSYSYNETNKHDFQIEDYVEKRQRTSVDYAYSFQAKPIEPLKNVKYFKKSSYWKLLSDFNFNYLPSNINFSATFLRQFNRQQFRQVDVEGIDLDPLYRRNYQFNYQYGFNYNLTKNLKVNYTAASNNIVRNYFDEQGNTINSLSIWDGYWDVGTPNQHNQQITVNYELPLNKIPFLSFLKSTYTYQSDYNWQRSSIALSSYTAENGTTYDLGNTIQNNASHKLNTALNMDMLYKYVGLVKSANRKPKAPTAPVTAPKPGEKVKPTTQATPNQGNVFVDGLIGIITCVKNLQINYTQTGGTVLPGYTPGLGFFGSSKPTLGFVFGSQADVRYEAAQNGYLTNYDQFNGNYTQVSNKKLDFNANIDLFPDFKIDLTAQRNHIENHSEQYDASTGSYVPLSPYSFGNYNMSTIMISTSFSNSDEFSSAAFDAFRSNRLTIANRLATQRGIDLTNPANINSDGFPVGYGKNSQQVLLPAFVAAYTGGNAESSPLKAIRDIPLPNWTIKYTGLMRYNFFKEKFRRFSIQHGYRASYTINSIRSNFKYDEDPNGKDVSGNFHSPDLITNVNLVEQFNPLVKVDMQLKNSMSINAELKRDRSLSMSFDNNLLTEVRGMDYVFGLGYRIKDVTFNSTMADNPQGIIKSDINIKADITYRNSKTIVRYLDYDNNQLAGGQNNWGIRFTADYSFSKNLQAIFYYDHTFTKAVISTSFPITNIRTGFTLKYNFGN